ncbi:MAG TPA: chemotaxis protein CheB [Vicinamibacterales bacterium]|jgi:two-component system chemotaxis response regulator CheB|nr:chemotaxis protein CheB [Vicinamibacterales bacterium]
MIDGTRLTGTIDLVVIGASAGGVEALIELLRALPPTLRAGVLIVLHLPRDRRSVLAEVFQPYCAVPVRDAQDKDPVEPGTVYLAPADYHLLVDDTRSIALSVDELVHFSRPSVDVLFEAAAEVYRERTLAILLTGGSDDGAAGLAAVRRAGGWTVVQDPSTARVPMMVEAALARGPVDFVLPLEGIAELLGRL